MDLHSESSLRRLLTRVAQREQSIDDALTALRTLPFEDLGHTRLDHHRTLRRGQAEAVYCAGKTPAQVAEIFARLAERCPRALGTRATRAHADAATAAVAGLRFDETAGCLWFDREPDRARKPGVVLVAAGTSDIPVAEEAAIALDVMGHAPRRIYDVGVAGLHRVLSQLPALRAARVIIVLAGMEGALPSVVSGLVAAPVIAVPTSVGYGASFNGLAALLGMLNTCSPGVAVVNIDNGYGAAHLAASINDIAASPAPEPAEPDVREANRMDRRPDA